MHAYRTQTCGELEKKHVGQTVRLAGWIHKKRDHGQLLFLDLRDHYGLTQCVIEKGKPVFSVLEELRLESVVSVTGKVLERDQETVNKKLPTGEVELQIETVDVLSSAEQLPILVATEETFPEDLRLKYRFIDLRREDLHKRIMLRSQVIASLRKRMIDQGFTEFQTPILTSSSPEGARDFLVPSRMHPGKFYALPQAPQQFKQLIMVSGFDRYFQIAPCFRDEDTRADRVLEFYQLDIEMSFVTQEDVFAAVEPVIEGVFKEFANGKEVTNAPFPRISFNETMLKYGTDKPDLRNPLIISDVTEVFEKSRFTIFANNIEKGFIVRAIPATGAASQPRSFFDKLNDWARDNDMAGLGYIIFDESEAKGPIAKNLTADCIEKIKKSCAVQAGDAVFFVCDQKEKAQKFAGLVRTKVCAELNLLEKDAFRLCWIVDFPMYKKGEETFENAIDFSHNPFSMPQGEMEALQTQDPLDIKAYQYDIVCNGYELATGAIRNHRPDIMYKAFEIAGYPNAAVEQAFGGMLNAFKYGAPPHGGIAPGVDRIVMLLADEPNLREVILFPINQRGEDLMMGAPSDVKDIQLKELHIKVDLPKKEKK